MCLVTCPLLLVVCEQEGTEGAGITDVSFVTEGALSSLNILNIENSWSQIQIPDSLEHSQHWPQNIGVFCSKPVLTG